MLEPFLDVKQTATLLQLSQYSIRRFIRRGLLEAAKIGRQWRIKETSVQEFYESKTHSIR